MTRTLVSVFALTALGACNGGGSDPVELTPIQQYEERLDDALAFASDIDSLAGTRFSAMPDAGTAQFEGIAGLVIDRNPRADVDDYSLLGDAALTADFGAGTLTGSVTNMVSMQGNVLNPTPNRLEDVGGRINIGNVFSQIGGEGMNPNEFDGNYSGLVTLNDETYRINGSFAGRFQGTRVNNPNTDIPMKGLVLEDVGDGIARDSTNATADVTLEIYAEQPTN